MAFNEQVINWVKRSLQNEELQGIVVDFSENSEIGLMSEIIFVTATGLTKREETKTFNLGMKFLKTSRRKMDICVRACRVELFVYSTVFPLLAKFLIDKELKKELLPVPKIKWCVDSPTESIIVMQNLKKCGYMLHNKQQHMNIDHLKVVFKEFGKFHAISFALRNQKPKLFNETTKFLIDNNITRMGTCFPLMIASFKNNLNTALEILKRNEDKILHEKLCRAFLKPPSEVLNGLLDSEEPQTTICHGDSWNNNFLFKYKDDDQTRPRTVKIIDWQLSGVRSPVFDLSQFFYASGSHEEFEKFDELLEFYYKSFSTFLSKLGSNPQELFTFSDLKRHWRIYGISGVIASLNLLKVQLSDEEAGDIECEDITETAVFDLPLNDMELYYSRLKAIGDDQTRPQAVKIIDWQLSGVRSPVFDLSYFIYSSGSHEEFEKFDELLEFYYESFSSFLTKLGSNPQELFTFSDLKRHWRRYGISGVIASLNSLKIQLSDEVPDVTEGEDGTETATFDLPLNDVELYYSRLKAIVSHYFSFVE